jgi:hypothetical protein
MRKVQDFETWEYSQPYLKQIDGKWCRVCQIVSKPTLEADATEQLALVHVDKKEDANFVLRLMTAAPKLWVALEDLIFQASNSVPWMQVDESIKKGRKVLSEIEKGVKK